MTQWKWQTASCLRSTEPIPEKFGKCCRVAISPLIWRIPILVWAMSILSWSVAFFWGPLGMFFLYMTHWGLLLIVIESVFGIIVTVKKSRTNYMDATFGLPWYVKTYWVLYNVTIPVAFLITVFYWGILKTSGKMEKYAPNPVLDVMLHGGNSVAMLVELLLSAHPSRLMHIFQPLLFALAYLLFTVVYYFAGGHDPWGNAFIYPVIDWSKPQQTAVVVTLTALFLALMHLVVVAVAATRDAISRRFRNTTGIYNDGFGDES
ncbi:unnamed protein product [Diatraea saccharalis]|uniref:Protein rolling stone-like n=1 Tax=Diatraea saccharalis TaxID=40085 RepID=A0A9N9REV4_9NEOP|nr:unnamed protein product [Diatraea saccharalis]